MAWQRIHNGYNESECACEAMSLLPIFEYFARISAPKTKKQVQWRPNDPKRVAAACLTSFVFPVRLISFALSPCHATVTCPTGIGSGLRPVMLCAQQAGDCTRTFVCCIWLRTSQFEQPEFDHGPMPSLAKRNGGCSPTEAGFPSQQLGSVI
jgi:hypothetical protein